MGRISRRLLRGTLLVPAARAVWDAFGTEAGDRRDRGRGERIGDIIGEPYSIG